MHSADWAWAFKDANQLAPFYPVPKVPDIGNIPLEGSKDWNFADLGFQCLETPGHTPGSVCLYFPESGNMFTGDTLFVGAVGRTDLGGGDMGTLLLSVKKLLSLPPETRVWPGHAYGETPVSTLAHERETNPYITGFR